MLEIVLAAERTEFAPGEVIEGAVRWGGAGPMPEGLTAAIGYRTEGRGTQDQVYVEEMDLNVATSLGDRSFRFTAPQSPYTFDGTLISLRWFIEATAKKDKVEKAITVSPWVEVVRLNQIKKSDIHDFLNTKKEQQAQQQQ